MSQFELNDTRCPWPSDTRHIGVEVPSLVLLNTIGPEFVSGNSHICCWFVLEEEHSSRSIDVPVTSLVKQSPDAFCNLTRTVLGGGGGGHVVLGSNTNVEMDCAGSVTVSVVREGLSGRGFCFSQECVASVRYQLAHGVL